MGILDFLKNPQGKKSTSSGAFRFNLFGASADIPVNVDVYSPTSTYSPQLTRVDARQFAPVDARSLIFIQDSPYASVTKKDAITGSVSSPSVMPSLRADSTGATIPVDIPVSLKMPDTGLFPNGILGGQGVGGNILLLGGLVVGGIVIVSVLGGKK